MDTETVFGFSRCIEILCGSRGLADFPGMMGILRKICCIPEGGGEHDG